MGCNQSSQREDSQEYQPAPSNSQEFRFNDTRENQARSPTLFLDPDAIDVEMTDLEGASSPSTPVKLESATVPKVAKPPRSPFVPSYLLEGRSFLQSPLGKKKPPLVDFKNSPTRNRMSREVNVRILQE